MRISAQRTLLFAVLVGIASSADAQLFETNQAELVTENGAGEGPAWHPELGLFASGDGGINLWPNSGAMVPFIPGAGTNGLLFVQPERLLVCQPKYRRICQLDVRTKKLHVLSDRYEQRKYNQPNDVSVDSTGRIFFSDPQYGERGDMQQLDANDKAIEGVYRVDQDGSVNRIISHEVDRPNGLLVTSDDRFLYVADNNNRLGGARKLWRFRLLAGGKVDLASKRLIFDWKTGRGPDGMVQDADGNLFVAAGRNQANPPHETADEFKGGVYVFSPQGDLLAFVAIPRDEVTNCTFGGKDLRTLYVTAGGSLWKIGTRTRGRLPWPIANRAIND